MVREPTFSPAEAAAITGVSTALQRKWRSAGGPLEPKDNPGWTRWTPKELARLLVLDRVSRLVGPAQAATMIAAAGNQGVDGLVWAFAISSAIPGKMDELTEKVGRFVVSKDSAPFLPYRSLANAVDGAAVPWIVLDAQALGVHLAQAVGTPLVFGVEVAQ